VNCGFFAFVLGMKVWSQLGLSRIELTFLGFGFGWNQLGFFRIYLVFQAFGLGFDCRSLDLKVGVNWVYLAWSPQSLA
jgi:hypothetical protein